MQVKTIKIKIKSNVTVERDLGLFFLNLMILSLLLPVFLEVLSMDIKKTNYRSIDSIPSKSVDREV